MTSPEALRAARTAHDLALLERIAANDEGAFEALYRAYYRPLVAFVLPFVQSGAIAEEVVEDVFVQLWQQRSTIHVTHTVSTYLFGATRNRALNVLRRERVERRWHEAAVSDGDPSDGVSHPTAERTIDSVRVREAVRHAIDGLSPARRTVLMLRWEQEMSYAEIARVMGSSVIAVERQLSRTLKALRLALPEWLSPGER
jgi:RNA polymerase sigma-70 factor (ECF subfamily)